MPERRRITKEAISLAYAILRELAMEAVPAPALVPTFAGGIQLEWHTKGADVEIEIGPGGSVAGDVEDLSAGTKWSFEGSPSAAMLERVRTRLAA